VRPDGLTCDVLDTWDVSGLRGTGSHDFRADGIFVPNGQSMDFVAPAVTGSDITDLQLNNNFTTGSSDCIRSPTPFLSLPPWPFLAPALLASG
jgi:hypothetical protein